MKVIQHPISAELLDGDAVAIIHRLTRFGHRAYLVGGCVRDLLLSRKPKDFDIGTTARPRQVKRLFRNCRIIGRRFRLAHVFFGEKIIEVSTFRRAAPEPTESNREDLLLLDENVFGSAEEDAFRRDFTVNGLFYDVEAQNILDYVDGMSDVERRVMRSIGDPEVRLREDPVRILRAIKFAARLDFTIDPATLAAIERHRTDILKSAKPRVLEEILRLFRGAAAARSFDLLRETRVLEVILAEFHEAVEREPAHWETIRRYLLAHDDLVKQDRDVPAAVSFATLIVPLVGLLDAASADARSEWAQAWHAFDATSSQIAKRIGLSRNDTGRLRQIGAALRKLVPQRQKRRYTRASIARQGYFADAFAFFEIHCRALGLWEDELKGWSEARARVPAQATGHGSGGARRSHSASARDGADRPAATSSSEPRRKRRRRGGRRRRRSAPARDSANGPSGS